MNWVKTMSAGARKIDLQLLRIFLRYSFLLWLFFPFMVFPYKA